MDDIIQFVIESGIAGGVLGLVLALGILQLHWIIGDRKRKEQWEAEDKQWQAWCDRQLEGSQIEGQAK